MRQHEFDQRLLRIKLGPIDERISVVRELAEQEGLSLAERRQLLIAIQRYILGSGGDVPRDLTAVLSAVLALTTQQDLRLKALELFQARLLHGPLATLKEAARAGDAGGEPVPATAAAASTSVVRQVSRAIMEPQNLYVVRRGRNTSRPPRHGGCDRCTPLRWKGLS